jgi:ribosomal protein S18 acetylase RimI-like enzyme
MTTAIVVRDARFDESKYITEMTRQMVSDMERYGGRTPSTDASAWDKHAVRVAEELKTSNSKYLIAENSNGTRIGVGAARIDILEGIFAAKRIVHLSVVYVLPSFRRAGVGSQLISQLLKWGDNVGGDYFDLNVVVGNPAKLLYEKFGFSDVAVNMTRPMGACRP